MQAFLDTKYDCFDLGVAPKALSNCMVESLSTNKAVPRDRGSKRNST